MRAQLKWVVGLNTFEICVMNTHSVYTECRGMLSTTDWIQEGIPNRLIPSRHTFSQLGAKGGSDADKNAAGVSPRGSRKRLGGPRRRGSRSIQQRRRHVESQRGEIEVQSGSGAQGRHDKGRTSRRGRQDYRRPGPRGWDQEALGYTGNYDGNDSRITGNNPDADTIARTRINATTIQTVSKKAGKVTTTSTQVISSDGKTRTITTKGTNGQGQTVNNVGVYEKQ